MVKEFSITLNPGPVEGVYTPGSTVSGHLTVDVKEPKSYKKIVIRVRGWGQVSWRKDRDTNYEASEEYLDISTVIWSSEDSPDGTHPAGRHVYPFQFVLPASCPSSFQAFTGHISYMVVGVVFTRTHKSKHTIKHPFCVLEVAQAGSPSHGHRYNKRKTVGFGLFKSEINYTVQLSTSCLDVCEEVPVSYYVENGSGRRIRPRCTLVEEVTYKAQGVTISGVIIVGSQTAPPIPPHTASGNVTINVPIPWNCRPAIAHSNIIRNKYKVIFTLAIPWAANHLISIPVKIVNNRLFQEI